MTYHLDADPNARDLAQPGQPTCGVWTRTHDGYGGQMDVHCGRPRGHEGRLHKGLAPNTHPVQYTANGGTPWVLCFTLQHRAVTR